MNIEKTAYSERYQRYCCLQVGVASVTILQCSSPVDFKMGAPAVNWPSLGGQSDLNFVQSFGEALQQAAEAAREWAQDTGKNYREVLPQ